VESEAANVQNAHRVVVTLAMRTMLVPHAVARSLCSLANVDVLALVEYKGVVATFHSPGGQSQSLHFHHNPT
jgi:hypothetical protein